MIRLALRIVIAASLSFGIGFLAGSELPRSGSGDEARTATIRAIETRLATAVPGE